MSRSATQPTPAIAVEDVARIIRRDFPAESWPEVFSLVDQTVNEWALHEPFRVFVAAMKSSDGDLERLRTQVALARTDYRDVIAQAEYARYMLFPPPVDVSDEAVARAIAEDWSEYSAWFTREA